MNKLCTDCNETKPLAEFHQNKARVDGLQVYCKICKRKRDRKGYSGNKQQCVARNAKNRKALSDEVNVLKAAHGCLYCQENDPCCLEFHHLVREEKEAAISKFVQGGARLKAFKEIKKCVVVCRNCHSKLHAGRELQRK